MFGITNLQTEEKPIPHLMHPMAISAAVPIPYSSAPSIAAMTMSRPVRNPPSVRKVIRSRRWFIART